MIHHDQIVQERSKLEFPCDVVDDIHHGLEIADRLRAALRGAPFLGIGLAANQIGLPFKIFVMDIPGKDNISRGFSFINPEISKFRNPIFFNEGCLSFPGQSIRTMRYDEVFILDDLCPKGRPLKGLAAVCAQHETDHTNGITMFDRKVTNIKPNGPCPCSSGIKASQCCLPIIREKDHG